MSATVTDGTRKPYGSYWNRVTEQWAARRLDEPTPSEIKQLVAYVRANVVPRRNARGGRSAAENLIAALRCLCKRAEDDGYIDGIEAAVRAYPLEGVKKDEVNRELGYFGPAECSTRPLVSSPAPGAEQRGHDDVLTSRTTAKPQGNVGHFARFVHTANRPTVRCFGYRRMHRA